MKDIAAAGAGAIVAIDLAMSHGGGQQVFLDFLRAAKRSGQTVTAMVAAGGWLDKSLSGYASNVSVPAPGRKRSGLVWRGVRFLLFFKTLVKHRALLRGAKEIVVSDPELFLPAALLGSICELRITLYLHMAYRGLAARVLRLAAGLSSVVRLICVSRFVESHVLKFLPQHAARKLALVENAVSESLEDMSERPILGDMSRVAVIGRLIPEKGQDVVCSLSHLLPDTRFYVIGSFDDADANFVETLRKQSASNVSLTGYQSPITDYLRQHRIGIVLVPSRITEACPLVPIEAAAAGCAVIVRNLGGLAEVAENSGLMTVDTDEEFLRAIRSIQNESRRILESNIQAASRRAVSYYHPMRFEQAIQRVFGWP